MEKIKFRGLEKNEQNRTSSSKVVAFSIKKWCLAYKHTVGEYHYITKYIDTRRKMI